MLGVIAAASFTASLFFLKFWKSTRDSLFLPFSVFFLFEGISRTAQLHAENPNEGHLPAYVLRLFGVLLILYAILKKNYGSRR